ncbi:hypothetical protein V8F06_008632 [Rhypophila decipiens]
MEINDDSRRLRDSLPHAFLANTQKMITRSKELTESLKQSQNSEPASKTSRAKSSHSLHSRRWIKPSSSSSPVAVLDSKSQRHDRQKCATKSTSPTSAATGAADLTQHHSPSSAADDKFPAWTEKGKAFFCSAGSGSICQWFYSMELWAGTGTTTVRIIWIIANSTANATTGFSESRELSDKDHASSGETYESCPEPTWALATTVGALRVKGHSQGRGEIRSEGCRQTDGAGYPALRGSHPLWRPVLHIRGPGAMLIPQLISFGQTFSNTHPTNAPSFQTHEYLSAKRIKVVREASICRLLG